LGEFKDEYQIEQLPYIVIHPDLSQDSGSVRDDDEMGDGQQDMGEGEQDKGSSSSQEEGSQGDEAADSDERRKWQARLDALRGEFYQQHWKRKGGGWGPEGRWGGGLNWGEGLEWGEGPESEDDGFGTDNCPTCVDLCPFR